MSSDPRRHAPATLRNREPLADTLAGILPEDGLVLELGSGTGEHASYLAARYPGLRWQPSDVDPGALASIDAYRKETGLANIEPALLLDVTDDPWPTAADAALSVNMIHIAPWECCLALLRGAARVLPAGGPLVIYGPFARDGAHTGPGNERFDRSLREQNPEWGVRDLGDVDRAASAWGLDLDAVIAMPADNLVVVFRKS